MKKTSKVGEARGVGRKRSRPRSKEEAAYLKKAGAKLKLLRQEAGMSGQALADAVGVVVQSQFHREAGKRDLTLVELYRYARALKCSVSELLP